MLPGNLLYWKPCGNGRLHGTINNSIYEPIHFFGPSPGPKAIDIEEEDEKEEPQT